jgi:hypothetical protein
MEIAEKSWDPLNWEPWGEAGNWLNSLKKDKNKTIATASAVNALFNELEGGRDRLQHAVLSDIT